MAALFALFVVVASALPASAADEESILRWAETITVEADGLARVELDLTWDFGSAGRHGPELNVVHRQGYDETHDRRYRIENVSATSADAPDDVHLEDQGAVLRIRIGDAETEVDGVHTYRISYTVAGWVNPADFAFPNGPLENDELNLNATGDSWDIPLHDASVTIVAPTSASATACYTGPPGSKAFCDSASAPGRSVTFKQQLLAPGTQLTVVTAFPAGTFATKPILTGRAVERTPFALTPWTGGVALAIAAFGSVLTVRRARRSGRDEQYAGLTPGLMPTAGSSEAVTGRTNTPVAVRFTPPEGLRPGQLGTLIDETADTRDVTSTIVDLAVRGYVLIEKLSEPEEDWRLVRTAQEPTDLVPYEDVLISQIFRDAGDTTLSGMRTTFSADLKRVQGLLYEDVTGRGWFRNNPQSARGRWAGRGVALVIAGGLLTAALAQFTSVALVGFGVVAIGLVTLVTTGMAPARTAAGSAVLAQTQGFRLYLETAEGDQLRFEEGEDLFSRYLPFAIAFGLTERWARVFADLAARGQELPTPTWYVGSWGYAGFWASAGTLDNDLTQFASAADSAVSAPTPGSSGSSGFSGGGFSGGGVGGGGGGSW